MKILENVATAGNSEIIPTTLLKSLRQCQVAGIDIAYLRNFYAFYWDMGVGKTALQICIALLKKSKGTVLVVTKEELIKDNIMKECERLQKSGLPEFNYSILIGARKSILLKKKIFESSYLKQSQKPEIYFTSFNVFKDLWEYICVGVKTLIIDESGLLRNVYSRVSIAFRHAKDKFDFENVYLFSGLPAPNSEIEYFTQMYLIAPELFGKSFENYKSENFRVAGQKENNPGKLVLKDPERFKVKLKEVSQYIGRSEIFDKIPELIRIVKYFDLTEQQRIYYDLVINQTKKYIREHSGESIEVLFPYIAKQAIWLQIICGYYISEDGKQTKLPTNLYDTLYDVTKDKNEPIIIWCNFNYEQASIVNMLAKKGKEVAFVHGGQRKQERSMARQVFLDGKAQYLVLKPRANAHGFNFQNVCNFAIYPTLTYSLDDNEQSITRIFRPPFKKVCTAVSLVARDTIQEVIYEAIKNKRSSALEVLNYLKK